MLLNTLQNPTLVVKLILFLNKIKMNKKFAKF